MGREHEDQHIYLYVYINPVAVFGKEKKTQYFKASMYSSLDYTTEKKMLTPFLLCGLGCCLIPGASSGLGPKCGVSRGWWGCVSQCAPSPNRPGLPAPFCMSSQPPDPGQPSCSENKPRAPKEWLSFWAGIALKNPLGCMSFGDGVLPQALFLRSHHLQMRACSPSGVAGTGMCPRNKVVEGRGDETQAFGVSSGTFHSNWH